MQEINFRNITIDKLSLPILAEKNIEADVLRLDKIHPVISGNKWFKLRFYLEEAKKLNKKRIVTFGGAWSNHIIATAAACKLNGFEATGIIRGEEASNLSTTLMQAKETGMQLIFISREDYKKKKIPEQIRAKENYFINEGGYGIKGVEGAATILDHCKKDNYTHICCAAGTGTTTAGLIKGVHPSTQVISISVLKNYFDLENEITSLSGNEKKHFQLIHDYHFGGYAKYKPVLLDFMNEFYRQTSIPSDFVYSGKLFYAISDLIAANYFPGKSRLLVIHCGGLQGNDSLKKGTLIF